MFTQCRRNTGFTEPRTGSAPATEITDEHRNAVLVSEGKRVARELAKRLPTSDEQIAGLLAAGGALAEQLSWDRVVDEMFLPAVRTICAEE